MSDRKRRPKIAIVVNYPPNKKRHHSYTDTVDLEHGVINYRGQGRRHGVDQSFKMDGNKILLESIEKHHAVMVFLDCGGVKFAPPVREEGKPKREKQLLYAGRWTPLKYTTEHLPDEARDVFNFEFRFAGSESELEQLKLDVEGRGVSAAFEEDLEKFAKARAAFYENNRLFVRSRDSIAAEVGEYFAVKALNKNPDRHIIRLPGSFKDVDAVDIKTGRSYAIKSTSKFPVNSSNIWADKDELRDRVDEFVVTVFEPGDTLRPQFVASIPCGKVLKYDLLNKAKRQGDVYQLKINQDLLKRAKCLAGRFPSLPSTRKLAVGKK